MKLSYTSNEMIQFVAHFDVSKIYEIKKEKKNFKFLMTLGQTLEEVFQGCL